MVSTERSPPRDNRKKLEASSCSDNTMTVHSTPRKSPEKSLVTPVAASISSPVQHASDTNSSLRERCAASSAALASPAATAWNINTDDLFPDSAESDYQPDLSDGDNDGAASHDPGDGIATRTRAQFVIDTVWPVSQTCASVSPSLSSCSVHSRTYPRINSLNISYAFSCISFFQICICCTLCSLSPSTSWISF